MRTSTTRFWSIAGLRNYWGYNTIGFFAPEAKYSSSGAMGEQVSEFKGMVRNLHAAGIEVILDVVYNHTGEGNHLGPTLSFRGVDNPAYYRLSPEDPRFYMDFTGTGNTFNLLHPRTLQLVMDSLRYWVNDMHVDGFRFDLASTLARDDKGVNKLHAFFEIIHQDPVLSQVKLIAEPWDVGEGGYQVGNFPVLWAEWNGKYRDEVRQFLERRRRPHRRDRLSPDGQPRSLSTQRPPPVREHQFHHRARRIHPERSRQLQRQAQRSQRRKQQGRRQQQQLLELRRRRADRRSGDQRAARAAAAEFSDHALPLAGRADASGRRRMGADPERQQQRLLPGQRAELARRGSTPRSRKQLLEFTKKLIQLRRDHPVFRRPKFFQGRRIRGSEIKDVMWFNPGGNEMSDEEWASPFVRCIGVLLSGDTIDVLSFEGEPIRDETFLLLINAHYEPIPFVLPGEEHLEWRLLLDTAEEHGFLPEPKKFASGDDVEVIGRGVKVLKLATGAQAQARHESWKKRQVQLPHELKTSRGRRRSRRH